MRNLSQNRRLVGISLALLLTATACNLSRSGKAVEGPRGPGKVGSGVVLPSLAPATPDASGNVPGSEVTKAGDDKVDTKPPPFAVPPPGGGEQVPPAGPSNQAYRYLNKEVPFLRFEIDTVAGANPNAAALSHFDTIFRGILDKEEMALDIDSQIDAERRDYDSAEIQAFEAANRAEGQTLQQAHVYILYMPGEWAGNPGVLGFAGGDRIVMFPDKMEGLAFPREQVERAVLVHEMGHLLRLVGQGYPRKSSNQCNGSHSCNDDSVMFYAIDTSGVTTVLSGKTSIPAQFDEDDLADLDDIKNGRF